MVPEILKGKKVAELRAIAEALGIKGAEQMKKSDLTNLLTSMHEEAEAQKAEKAEEPSEDKKKKSPGRRTGQGRKPAAKGSTGKKAGEQPAKQTADIPSDQPVTQSAEAPAEQPEAKIICRQTEKAEDLTEEAHSGKNNAQCAEKPSDAPRKDGRYERSGILELADGGFGFLRFDNFLTSDEDVYVSPMLIRRFNLKTGDIVSGVIREPGKDERFGAMLYVKAVNGDEPGAAIRRRDFSDLTPIFPSERIRLEKGSNALSMRLMDLVAPIGKGQRGLIVAPPKAGKTTLLKQIAASIEAQNVDAELIVLLIDERPEEVTDMQESIKGRVIYSTFDEQPQHHVKVAEMVLARAQRLAEHGKDVIILLDSITRLARAYNLVEPSSGKILSGGLDPAALYKPKKFYGAARNLKEGGSITILATALIETGSRMDDLIFEEFKGTGNMELHLDRKLQEKRIFPAININRSGTRREDMLMDPEELECIWMMRRALGDTDPQDATEQILFHLTHSRSNRDFIERMRKVRL